MTKKQKKEAIDEFLVNKLEDTVAKMAESTKEAVNLIDQHFLSAMMMSIKILIDENEKDS